MDPLVCLFHFVDLFLLVKQYWAVIRVVLLWYDKTFCKMEPKIFNKNVLSKKTNLFSKLFHNYYFDKTRLLGKPYLSLIMPYVPIVTRTKYFMLDIQLL